MKRFWAEATVIAQESGFAVVLDGRNVKTPAAHPLLLPNSALAQAIAGEWAAVADEILPNSMPLTGLANAALDIVATDHAAFSESLARYAQSDLICYRADHPASLVARQARLWDPLLEWAERRFEIRFRTTMGITPIDQPPALLERVKAAYAELSPFRLAAMSPLVSLSGSAIIPLVIAERVLDAESAWAAAMLDEDWQADQWGEDSEAKANRQDRFRQFMAAAYFLKLAES